MAQSTQFEAPDLSDERILRIVAGIRPCRHGGLRLETEQLGSKTLIHNYGHGGCGITLSMGTAIAAADLLDQCSESDAPIAILGAGVVGLTTARELTLRGRKVTIYSEKSGTETLSALAGALFLPVGIETEHPDIGQERFLNILIDSKHALNQLDQARFGIQDLPVYEPAFAADSEFLFTNGTIAPPTDLDLLPIPGPPRSGRTFNATFIHTHRFLNTLIEDLANAGVEIQSRSFTDRQELEHLQEPTIVNCLALGSRSLFDDKSLYPARGILVHMEPQDLGYIIHDGYKYMFPREDALVLGGCFDEGVWDDTPDELIANEILAHHRRFFGLS